MSWEKFKTQGYFGLRGWFSPISFGLRTWVWGIIFVVSVYWFNPSFSSLFLVWLDWSPMFSYPEHWLLPYWFWVLFPGWRVDPWMIFRFWKPLPPTIYFYFCRTIANSSICCSFLSSSSPALPYPSRSSSTRCYWIINCPLTIACTYPRIISLVFQFRPSSCLRSAWVESLLILSSFLTFIWVFCCLTRAACYSFSIFLALAPWSWSSLLFIAVWL